MVGRTSASCGAIPILGDFAGEHGPIPSACEDCVNPQCCSQANDCPGDDSCKADRELARTRPYRA